MSPVKAPPASEQIATGTSPDGKKVVYFEADRPETVSRNAGGFLIIVVDASTGEKVTHSDSLEGLIKAGFKVDGVEKSTPTPPAPASAPQAQQKSSQEAAKAAAGAGGK